MRDEKMTSVNADAGEDVSDIQCEQDEMIRGAMEDIMRIVCVIFPSIMIDLCFQWWSPLPSHVTGFIGC